MIIKYFSYSISLIFISFIIGMILTATIRKSNFYNQQLANLNFVRNEMINKIIGIGIIKWIVKNTFFKYLNQNLKINRRINLTELKNIRSEMTKSEIDHLFAFLFVLIFFIVTIYKQQYLFSIIILIVNIVMNLYPSLLQQQNKRRIDKLINKLTE